MLASYLRVAPLPDDPPLVDPVDRPALPAHWWEEFEPVPRVDDALDSTVVSAFCDLASVSGYSVDATTVELRQDEDTGLEQPFEVRYRGLAVLYNDPPAGHACCADPHGTDIVYLMHDVVTFIRLDPFAGGQALLDVR